MNVSCRFQNISEIREKRNLCHNSMPRTSTLNVRRRYDHLSLHDNDFNLLGTGFIQKKVMLE